MPLVAMKCPACGADIEMDDSREFGFCSYCGTKVVRDKIIVEHRGSVKIDTSDEIKNLYELARRAKNNNNTKNAQTYYEQVVVKDPKSWEANFYSVYYQSYNCVIAEITTAANNMKNNLETTFKLIKENVEGVENQKAAVNEVVYATNKLATMLYNSSVNHFASIDSSIKNKYIGELNIRKNATQVLSLSCGDYVVLYFGEDFIKYSLESWKIGVSRVANRNRRKQYIKKIKQYEPTYKAPKSGVKIGCLSIILFLLFCFLFVEIGAVKTIIIYAVAVTALIIYKAIKKKSKTKSKKHDS